MMNDLQIFANDEFGTIRTAEIEDKVYFCGSDVAKALGYANAPDALQRHCKLDGIVKHDSVDSKGRKNTLSFVSEGNVYRLIAHSKLPDAEGFERWVFDEVLPSIRKHGAYSTETTIDKIIADPSFGIKLLTQLKSEQDKNKVLSLENSQLVVDKAIMQPKADYFDELVNRNLLTNFRETAKQLEVGEKKFIKFLLEHKFIYRDKRGKLMPYAEKNKGLFELKETFNEKTKWSGTQTLITPKGRETFRLLFLKG